MKKLLYFTFTFGLYCSVFAQPIPEAYQKLETGYNKNDFEACLKLSSEIEGFAINRIDTIVANSFFYLGESHNQLGDLDKALGYFERENTIRKKLSEADRTSYSNSLYNLMYLYLQAGHYEKAGASADELLMNDRKIYDAGSPEFAASVFNIADVYIQLDRFNEAEKLLTSTIKRQPKRSLPEGNLLNKLGDLYSYTGQFSKASKALEASADILFDVAGENSPEYLSAAINLGILYMNQGKYPEAEEVFEIALNIIDPSLAGYNAVLNNQALVYQSLGQLDRAESTFNKIRSLDSVAMEPLILISP